MLQCYNKCRTWRLPVYWGDGARLSDNLHFRNCWARVRGSWMRSSLHRVGILPVVLYLFMASHVPAQSIMTSTSEPGRNMNEQQVRGEGLFLQRCSLCHLTQAKRLIPDSKPYGPSLVGLLRDAGAAKEKAVRELILKGGPRMPGFQYGLTPEQMDDLTAFLKTL